MTPYSTRRDRYRELIKEEGLGGALITHAANRYYLSGFELHDAQCNESSGALFIHPDIPDEDWLFTDPRYVDAVRRIWPEERIFVYQGARVAQIGEFLARKLGNDRELGIEPRGMDVQTYQGLAKELKLTPVDGLVEKLRIFKDEAEIAAMRKSCAVNHKVMEAVPALLEQGMTEKELHWEIEKRFHEFGATELAFSGIVAFGPNGALPHAIPGGDRLTPETPVLIDVGGRADDYCSDQTRCFWFGMKESDEYRRTLELVQGAQQKALDMMGPGVTYKEAYAAAYSHFAAKGVEAAFTHGLGHGIGLETHEPPSLNPKAEGELKPGMVVTVEPGLYYPEWGGIRWEFMVLVTETGIEIL